jgi:hypothetical protein
MIRIKCITFIILLVVINLTAVEFDGFVDNFEAASLNNSGEYNAGRTRIRLNLRSEFSDVNFFASANAVDNRVLKDETKVKLHEAYLEYISDNWDLRFGKQIVTWGKADGLRITDQICPGDYSEFITQDFDDIRIPVDMLKFRYLPEFADFEFIWIPTFEPSISPANDSPWNKNIFTGPVDIEQPEKNLENSEIAGKASFYLSGFDIAFSAFYTWDDTPTTKVENGTLFGKYYRSTILGIDLNKTIGEFVVRSEGAVYIDKRYSSTNAKIIKKNLINAMLGLDWYPGNDWTLTAQLADKFITDYNDELIDDEHSAVATMSISKKLFRELLECSAMVYYGFEDDDMYNKLEADYAVTDDFHAVIGTDIFIGDEGMYGQYEDQSQVWIKARYDF